MKKQFTLSKTERLKSRKRIDQLFSKGVGFAMAPFRVYFMFEETEHAAHLQAAFGVSTRLFKKAVQRNRVKRLMKEVYRINKKAIEGMLIQHNLRLSLFLLYTGKELPDYNLVDNKVQLILERLRNIINEKAALHS